jgi:Pectinacetylesterase
MHIIACVYPGLVRCSTLTHAQLRSRAYRCIDTHAHVLSAGDTAQGLAQGTQYWAFRGRRVVAALADQLVARQSLGNATDVLVTGDSAGGVSALNNADFMLQRVKAALPRC